MELTIVGAGPAYTNRPGAVGASYLLVEGEAALVLDLGHGAFANLAARVEPSRLTAVVVSHLHPDHFVDLVPLRHYLRFEFQPPRRVRVLGPAGLDVRLDDVNGEDGFSAAALDVERLIPGAIELGPFRLEAARVTHTTDSYALRVSAGGSALVYSGDCGRAEDLLPLLQPGDTLLAESSFGAGPVAPGAQHLDSRAAARAATAGRARRLLLTHVQMGFDRAEALDAAQRGFDGPVAIVTEGDCFEL